MKRPLIATQPISEFGELDPTLDDQNYDAAPDMTYTPGWSELRRQRDQQMQEYQEGRRAGKDVMALPGNLRLVRRQSVGGKMDGVKMMGARNNGYRAVTQADLGQPWFTEMPIGAAALPDGTIVNSAGDCQWMWCDAPQAARNKARNTTRWMAQSGGVEQAKGGDDMKFSDIADAGNSVVDSAKPVKGIGKAKP